MVYEEVDIKLYLTAHNIFFITLANFHKIVWPMAVAETIVWAGLYYAFPALLVEWEAEDGTPERGDRPGRRFSVTGRGIAALQESREAYRRLGEGLEELLGESGS